MRARTVLATLILVLLSCHRNPFVQGERLYNIHCSNCHMNEGEGLGSLYPPLKTDAFQLLTPADFACIVRHGLSDSIVIGIQTYDTPMEGIPKLSAAEIANIYNYIGHNWHRGLPRVTELEMQAALSSCQQSY